MNACLTISPRLKSDADDFGNILAKIMKISINGSIIKEYKIWWQKETLLIISNVSFCHQIFKILLLQGVRKCLYVGKG